MKLHNKIVINNLVISALFLFASGFILMYIVRITVLNDLDEHLVSQKQALLYRLAHENVDLKTFRVFGVEGSQEWVEVVPWKGDTAHVPTDNFKNVYLSNIGQLSNPREYRELSTVIKYNGKYYEFRYLEAIQQWQNIIKSIVLTTFGSLLIFMVALYTFNDRLFKRLLSPFYNTVKELSTIHDSSGFKKTFPASSIDEINELHKAVNRMLSQLSDYFEEQKEFIQNASHELQTPLTIIYQKAESLLSNPDLDENTFHELIKIQESANRLSRLSKALLMISRIENRQFPLNDHMSVKTTIENVVRELEDFTESLNISVEAHLTADKIVKGNKELIHALFYNLIQNSVKFSPENSEIAIYDKVINGQYIITVKDSGIGISPEVLPKIFKRFKKDIKHWNDSPGLGLAIVKSICDLHGFECTVNSKQDQGTDFNIFIPNT